MEKKLSELKPGEKGKIIEVKPSIQAGVAGMGIRKGKTIKVSSKQPAGGPLVIEIEGNQSSLGKGLTKLVIVEAEK